MEVDTSTFFLITRRIPEVAQNLRASSLSAITPHSMPA
jgi:hypothetical protein